MTTAREFFDGLFGTLTGRATCGEYVKTGIRGSEFCSECVPCPVHGDGRQRWIERLGALGAKPMTVTQSPPEYVWERDVTNIHPVGTQHCTLHGYASGGHSACVINTGPYCGEPVTQGQIDEGDAFPIDERGPDDGRYEHVWCVQPGGK